MTVDIASTRGIRERACVCGVTAIAEKWFVVNRSTDQAALVEILSPGYATRCSVCNRTVPMELPVLVSFTVNSLPTLAMVTDSPPDSLTVESFLGGVGVAEDAHVDFVPEVALYLLATRDPEADFLDPGLFVAEVLPAYGEGVAEAYAELLTAAGTRVAVMGLMALLERSIGDGQVSGAELPDVGGVDADSLALARRGMPQLAGLVTLLLPHADVLQRGGEQTDQIIAAALDEYGNQMSHRFRNRLDAAEALIERNEHTSALSDLLALAAEIEDLGAPVLLGHCHWLIGQCLEQVVPADPQAHFETLLVHRRAALLYAGDDLERAVRSVEMAMTLGRRVSGDPAMNLDEGASLVEDALAILERLARSGDGGDPDRLAWARTNGGYLLELIEGPDRERNLRRARRMLSKAAKHRQGASDATDWAYSALNLSNVYLGEYAARGRRSALMLAAWHCRRILRMGARIAEDRLLGYAHLNLSFAEGQLSRVGGWIGRALATASAAHIEDAVRLLEGENDALAAALLRQAGQIEERDPDGALDLARRAFEAASAGYTPGKHVEAAFAYGDRLAARLDWANAAEVFNSGADAADSLYFSRRTGAGRIAVAADAGNIHRWASFALSLDGKLIEAVLALERGTAREMRMRLPLRSSLIERLGVERPQLCDKYLNSLESYRRHAGITDDPSFVGVYESARIAASDHLGAGVGDVGWDEVEQTADASGPVVYVNPSPNGTAILVVHPNRPTSGRVSFRNVTEVTSSDIAQLLLAGAADGQVIGLPYLMSVSQGSPADVPGFEECLATIGHWIARSIFEELAGFGYESASLVVFGPLKLVPVHATQWIDGSSATSLIDQYDVTFLPSSAVVARCAQMAVLRRPDVALVALGNSEPVLAPLDGAVAEIEAITDLVGPNRVKRALGSAAQLSFLEQHVAGATHLHVACHSAASALSTDNAVLILADGPVPVERLASSGLSTDLTVMSSCQTGLVDLGNVERSVSIASALLLAGSAAVVGTLWPIDDHSTGLLMTRFYELWLGEARSFASALRLAQLWLRDLSRSDALEYIRTHPALDYWTPAPGVARDRPFSASEHWAGFFLTGREVLAAAQSLGGDCQ